MQTTLLGFYSLKGVGDKMLPIILALFEMEHLKVVACSIRRHRDG